MRRSCFLFLMLVVGLGVQPGPLAAQDGVKAEWGPARALRKGEGEEVVRVRALSARAPEIQLEYALPELKVVRQGIGKVTGPKGQAREEDVTHLVLGNAPSVGDAGKPVLPVVPCTVVLPAGQVLDRVDIVCGKPTVLPGKHRVRHGQKSVPLLPGAQAEYTPPDPDVYDSDDPWPRKKFHVIGVQKKRGVSLLIVNLNPVVYRPKSGQLSCFSSMNLKVKTKPAPRAPGGGADKNAVKYRPDPVRPLSLQVDNPAALDTYGEGGQ